jgi:hypothetical protein
MEERMQPILDRLIERINTATLHTQPDLNIYIENIFPPDIYSEILLRLPDTDKYAFINHPDAILPDGTITRKLLTLSDQSLQTINPKDKPFWTMMNKILISDQLQHALVEKFHERIKQIYGDTIPNLANVPIFYRDYPGYKIGVHTDAPFKVITMQFYFPKDESQLHLGTLFHQRQDGNFQVLKTNLFKPNSAYAFVRSEQSWHSVKQIPTHELTRDSLALTVYLKEHEEYQRVINIHGSRDYA